MCLLAGAQALARDAAKNRRCSQGKQSGSQPVWAPLLDLGMRPNPHMHPGRRCCPALRAPRDRSGPWRPCRRYQRPCRASARPWVSWVMPVPVLLSLPLPLLVLVWGGGGRPSGRGGLTDECTTPWQLTGTHLRWPGWAAATRLRLAVVSAHLCSNPSSFCAARGAWGAGREGGGQLPKWELALRPVRLPSSPKLVLSSTP